MQNRMYKLRNSFGLTQEKLAEKVNEVNENTKISQQHISNIERKKVNPSIKVCKAIAKVLKTNIEEIF